MLPPYRAPSFPGPRARHTAQDLNSEVPSSRHGLGPERSPAELPFSRARCALVTPPNLSAQQDWPGRTSPLRSPLRTSPLRPSQVKRGTAPEPPASPPGLPAL